MGGNSCKGSAWLLLVQWIGYGVGSRKRKGGVIIAIIKSGVPATLCFSGVHRRGHLVAVEFNNIMILGSVLPARYRSNGFSWSGGRCGRKCNG